MSVELRASDDDRQRVIAVLQRHTEAGRLTLEEFSERVGEVYTARTLGQLATLTQDLPTEPSPAAATAGTARRDLLVIFAVAAVTLLLLGIFMAVTR
ncbi:DUF1707 SHOCT-like domain-containing protein [Micromonospora sp. CPCC 206061]|uniref:DUF1707 SHOCT-like domain-containing protein n=1 Tax=Micromonospora sp. CPCC 206061 TaxID=3122410 RepID=UPI002FF3F8AE